MSRAGLYLRTVGDGKLALSRVSDCQNKHKETANPQSLATANRQSRYSNRQSPVASRQSPIANLQLKRQQATWKWAPCEVAACGSELQSTSDNGDCQNKHKQTANPQSQLTIRPIANRQSAKYIMVIYIYIHHGAYSPDFDATMYTCTKLT